MEPSNNPYRKQWDVIVQLWKQRDQAEQIFGTERVVLLALAVAQIVMPAMVVRGCSCILERHQRKVAIELWALFRPGLLIAILAFNLWNQTWTVVASAVALADMFLYLFGIVFLTGFWAPPVSYSRSLILLAINLFEFAAGFAIFYLHFGLLRDADGIIRDSSSAFYFSVVTVATVGYGDIYPFPGWARLVVTGQVILAMAYMAIIISSFVSNLGVPRTSIKPSDQNEEKA